MPFWQSDSGFRSPFALRSFHVRLHAAGDPGNDCGDRRGLSAQLMLLSCVADCHGHPIVVTAPCGSVRP